MTEPGQDCPHRRQRSGAAIPSLLKRAPLKRTADFGYFSLADLLGSRGRKVADYPYAIRIILENVCRTHHAGAVWQAAAEDIDAVVDWRANIDRGVPLQVARVILPDSSGLPVLLDLAALKDAVARAGGDPGVVDPSVPVDLIVDHSLQVDNSGAPDAMARNLKRDFERNGERYAFLKWAQHAFRALRVFPPGTGIIHQVNLEHIASVVATRTVDGQTLAFPDFVIGGDSHTPMVNSLGVLGWGVGGLDAEMALLGQPYIFPIPDVVGVRLTGKLPAGSLTTDLALTVTERLRQERVTGKIVEYFGPAIPGLSIPERATLANMAPEYGATCGLFPVDEKTLAYLRMTGRKRSHVALVEAYCRANGLFRENVEERPAYGRVIEIDLDEIRPAVAGPRRPQDRLALPAVAGDFAERLAKPLVNGGFGAPAASPAEGLRHGAVVIAALTSCTNTSNPRVMLAAGLVAKKAASLGLKPPAWVKTSLAPGSQVVTAYLKATHLMPHLEALGFHVIGYGCTTCGGKSGPLDPAVAEAIERDKLVVSAVLSGNRNFEGRIHRLVRANYIASPPLVVLYALAGTVDIDLEQDPVGHSHDGKPVFMTDLWPSPEELDELVAVAEDTRLFTAVYDHAETGPDLWNALEAPASPRFPWRPTSTYLIEPPFLKSLNDGWPDRLSGARVLAAFGDSLTTDHVSPGGEIPPETPAGQYLLGEGVQQRDFNSYVARRCNHEVMMRATFANIRIKNALTPEIEGGMTRHFPDGEILSIFDASTRYRQEGTPVIVLAGKEYGTGSSRDWAAKGPALLGLRAVIAESFERIHRANLVGMGILPLTFAEGDGWRQLGLTGEESYELKGLRDGISTGAPIEVAARADGRTITFKVQAQLLTDAERRLIDEGGMLPAMLRRLLAEQKVGA